MASAQVSAASRVSVPSGPPNGPMFRRAVLLMLMTLVLPGSDLSPVALEAISEISVAMVEQPEAREVFEDGSAGQVVTVLQSIFANYLQDKLS